MVNQSQFNLFVMSNVLSLTIFFFYILRWIKFAHVRLNWFHSQDKPILPEDFNMFGYDVYKFATEAKIK